MRADCCRKFCDMILICINHTHNTHYYYNTNHQSPIISCVAIYAFLVSNFWAGNGAGVKKSVHQQIFHDGPRCCKICIFSLIIILFFEPGWPRKMVLKHLFMESLLIREGRGVKCYATLSREENSKKELSGSLTHWTQSPSTEDTNHWGFFEIQNIWR